MEQFKFRGGVTRLFHEFTNSRDLWIFTRNIAHTGGHFNNHAIKSRPILLDQDDERFACIVVANRHNCHRSGRTHYVARKCFTIGRYKITDNDFPEVSVVHLAIPDMAKCTHLFTRP